MQESEVLMNISGKDFLSEKEAAFYCCVSYSHYRRWAQRYQIPSFTFMGKKIYRKSDLRAIIESQCEESENYSEELVGI